MHVLPMAESIAKLMGAAVSIFIVGPIPDANGVIENRSINVNHPGGISSQTWPDFDPHGFTMAEDSFKAYGVANFSELIPVDIGAHDTHTSGQRLRSVVDGHCRATAIL